jgi:hypothetical protein
MAVSIRMSAGCVTSAGCVILSDARRRSQADADFVKAKTELVAIRVREKERELIEFDEAKEATEKAIGIVLTAMSGMAARCGGSDLQLRRKIDQVVYETRVQLANTFNRFADEAGEPPLLQEPVTDNTEEDDKLRADE